MTRSIDRGVGTETTINGIAGTEKIGVTFTNPKDLRVVSESPGESLLTLVTSPVDQPCTFRTSVKDVANIYNGSDIDPSAYLPSKRGQTTYVELREVWKETDSGDPSWSKLMPVRIGISMTVPEYSGIAVLDVTTLISRAATALVFQPSDNALTLDRIASLMRGVLRPKNVV